MLSKDIIKHPDRSAIFFLLAFYTVVMLRNAWVCDDAYISFRVVDNFVNGYGLRWNVADRVQAFTNPLWVFLISSFYWITGNIYFTVIVVSVILSVSAATIYGYRLSGSWPIACVGILILSLSDAYMDYSTSGLENPLIFFLIVLFAHNLLNHELTIRRLLVLCLIASLSYVNRPDSALLFIPALIMAFWKVRSWRALRITMIGSLPIMVWEIFSLIYYGFLFPNTAYAKLETGVESSLLIKQGFCYLLNSLNVDPLTVLVIVLAFIVPILTRRWQEAALVLGIILTLAYVVRIGGCFMSGRFLAAPLLVSVIVLSRLKERLPKHLLIIAAGIFAILGLTQEFSPVRTLFNRGQYDEPVFFPNAITDERKFYFLESGLINFIRRAKDWPVGSPVTEGLDIRNKGINVHVAGCIGRLGFFAGPDVHILDINALADPLLARLPAHNRANPTIGHFERRIPPGYKETLDLGENKIIDDNLADYYDRLALVTRGGLFSFQRLKEIIKINLGSYDHLVDRYVENDVVTVSLDEVCGPKEIGTIWNAEGNYVIKSSAFDIIMERDYYAVRIEISTDNNDDYRILFYRGDKMVGEYVVSASIPYMEGLNINTFDVPESARESGFDRLRIIPERGDGMYSVGHVNLIEDKSD